MRISFEEELEKTRGEERRLRSVQRENDLRLEEAKSTQEALEKRILLLQGDNQHLSHKIHYYFENLSSDKETKVIWPFNSTYFRIVQ